MAAQLQKPMILTWTLLFLAAAIHVHCEGADLLESPERQYDVLNATAYEDTTVPLRFDVPKWPPYACEECNTTAGNISLELFYQKEINDSGLLLCTVWYIDSVFRNGLSVPCNDSSNQKLDIYNEYQPTGKVEFTLVEPRLSDQGFYKLVLKENKVTDSFKLLLNVFSPPSSPEITTSPALEPIVNGSNEIVHLVNGSTLNLTCIVTEAKPPATIRWSLSDTFSNVNDPAFTTLYYNVNGTTTVSVVSVVATVTLTGTDPTFWCGAWNDINADTPAIQKQTVPMNYHPLASSLGHDSVHCVNGSISVRAGRDVKFKCVVFAFPSIDNVWWYWKNASQTDYMEKMVFNNINDSTDTSYKVNVSKWMQDSHIACAANNSYGMSDMATCRIEVQYPPVITMQDHIQVDVGIYVALNCTSDANPPASSWSWSSTVEGQQQGHNTLQYKISNVSIAHEGNYTCQAINIIEGVPTESSRATTRLIVKAAPKWSSKAVTKYSLNGEGQTKLVCAVNHHASVSFQWNFNGIQLNASDKYQLEHSWYCSVLTISKSSDSDVGNYTCRATSAGKDSNFTIQALSPGKPDPPISCSNHNKSSTEMTFICIMGFPGGDDASLKVFVDSKGEHKGLPSTVWDYEKVASGQSSDIDCNVERQGDIQKVVLASGLKPGTEYNVSIFATNKHGQSDGAVSMGQITTVEEGIPNIPGDNYNSALIGGIVAGVLLVMLCLMFAAGAAYVQYEKHKNKGDMIPIIDNAEPFDDDQIIREEISEDLAKGGTTKTENIQSYPAVNSLSNLRHSFTNDQGNSKIGATAEATIGQASNTSNENDLFDKMVTIRSKKNPNSSRRFNGHSDTSDEVETNIDELISSDKPNKNSSLTAPQISVKDSSRSLGVIELHVPPPTGRSTQRRRATAPRNGQNVCKVKLPPDAGQVSSAAQAGGNEESKELMNGGGVTGDEDHDQPGKKTSNDNPLISL